MTPPVSLESRDRERRIAIGELLDRFPEAPQGLCELYEGDPDRFEKIPELAAEYVAWRRQQYRDDSGVGRQPLQTEGL